MITPLRAQLCLLGLVGWITWTGSSNAAGVRERWLNVCEVTHKGSPIDIKDANGVVKLTPLKTGDLLYQLQYKYDANHAATLVFRKGKLFEITQRIDTLQRRHIIYCGGDEPNDIVYPLVVHDVAAEEQLLYDEFGVITDFFTLKHVHLGAHSRCPIVTDLIVAEWKRREVESKGIPFIRFCAASQNNSWFWFDPETGRRRADYMIEYVGGKHKKGTLAMAEFFFTPLSCFLKTDTHIDVKVGAREGAIKPRGCVFRYSPLTGKPMRQEEGRALATLVEFVFGQGSEGGVLDDTQKLGTQKSRRLSRIRIEIIKKLEK